VDYEIIDTGHYQIAIRVTDYFEPVGYTAVHEIGLDLQEHGINKAVAETHLISLINHITYVRQAGLEIGVNPRQLAEHDISKFSLEEFPHYARQYAGDRGNPDGYARAWLHHIHHNPHHWQHWIFPDGYSPANSQVENGAIPMPPNFSLEMIADWMGASMAYTGSFDMMKWLYENMPRIRLHSKTAYFVRKDLDMLSYADVVYMQKWAHEAG